MSSPDSQRDQKDGRAMRAAGLRPLEIWVPDTRRPGFAEECRRQSLLIAGDPLEKEVLAWIGRVSDIKDWN